MIINLVAVAGYKGVGKTTLEKFVVENYKVVSFSIPDLLKACLLPSYSHLTMAELEMLKKADYLVKCQINRIGEDLDSHLSLITAYQIAHYLRYSCIEQKIDIWLPSVKNDEQLESIVKYLPKLTEQHKEKLRINLVKVNLIRPKTSCDIRALFKNPNFIINNDGDKTELYYNLSNYYLPEILGRSYLQLYI